MIGAIHLQSEFTVNAQAEALTQKTVDGEIINTYERIACVRLKLVPRSSMTIKQADRVADATTHLAVAHYRPDLHGTTRFVLDGGRVLEVSGQPRRDKEPNARFLEMDCIERERLP